MKIYIRLYIRAAMLFFFRCHGYGSRRHLVSSAARWSLCGTLSLSL
jgi:hypothetical protein